MLRAQNDNERRFMIEGFATLSGFVRSTPGVTTALVGMKSPDHVAENLAVSEISPLSEENFFELFTRRA